MSSRCPQCGNNSVVTQDIETLSNSALLVKLEKRLQLTCQQCGRIEFDDPNRRLAQTPPNPFHSLIKPAQACI